MSDFLSKFKNFGKKTVNLGDQELKENLEKDLSVSVCDNSCESSSCDSDGEVIWPQFKKLDLDSPLYNSSKPSTIQFLIPTNKDNWKHDAVNDEFEQDSVPRELNLLLKDFEDKGKFGINVVDQPIGDNIFDKDIIKYRKLEKMYIVPFFITLNNVWVNELEDMLDIMIPALLNTEGIHTRAELINKLNGLFEKLSCSASPLDLNNLLLLCSHKNRDKKCGISAPIMKKEIFKQIETFNTEHEEKAVGKTDVWFTNHVGGHKFQANLQIYLNFKNDDNENSPESAENGNLFIWLARVAPKDCKEIVKDLLVKKGDKKSDRKLLLAEKVRCRKRFTW